MKIIKLFFSFIISLVLVLDLFTLQLSMSMHEKLLNTNYYNDKFQVLGLYSLINSTLLTDVAHIQHQCNLPSDVFQNIFTEKTIKVKINKFISETINYITFKSSKLPSADISDYSNEFNNRLDNYISSNNVILNSESKNDIAVIKKQTSEIINAEIYPINFDNITTSSSFQKFRFYANKIYSSEQIFIALFIFLTAVLMIINFKKLFFFFVWISSILIAGGLLTVIPTAALLNTNFMDRLALNPPKLLSIVSTITKDYLQSILHLGLIFAALGCVIFVTNFIVYKYNKPS